MTRDNRGGGGHTRKHALEIDRVLVLSTAHLPESVATGIEPRMDRVASMTGEYGWLVYVGNEAFEPEYLELNDLLEAKEVLLKLCEFARKQKCDYLLFDRDGDTVGEFPTFEW